MHKTGEARGALDRVHRSRSEATARRGDGSRLTSRSPAAAAESSVSIGFCETNELEETLTLMERIEKMRVSDDALDLLFGEARTYNSWLPKPVPDELLQQLYDTLKWGPTSSNISPARFVFIRSAAAKERLRPSLAPGNVEKTMAAPATVIIAYDLKFYDKLSRLFPHYPAMLNMFVNNPS